MNTMITNDNAIKIIESKQLAQCFDCGRTRKIYAVQALIRIVKGQETKRGFWLDGATCRKCYKEYIAANCD